MNQQHVADQGGSKSKKRRRSSASKNSESNNSKGCYDLWVPLPRESAVIHVREIRRRLARTGFTHMAVTHTVFGAPKVDEDEVDVVLPESIWLDGSFDKKKASKRKAKDEEESTEPQPSIKVIRRLHAVLENLADVGQYTKRRPDATGSATASAVADILQDFDLVSLSPRSDATFQSACKTALGSDIIVLDYTTGRGGVQLPFKMRPTDIKAAIARNAVFEIPYGPAILNRNSRKGLIQTCRLLHLASLGCKPKVLLSSGRRTATVDGDSEDVGAMALRTPSDLRNMLEVVMKMDSRMSFDALHTAGTFALQQAHLRRFGTQSLKLTGVSVVYDGVFETEKKTKSNDSSKVALAIKDSKEMAEDNDDGSAGSDNGLDGFIAM